MLKLKDKITLLLRELDTDLKRISEYTTISYTALCYLRSPAKSYKPDSPTVRKFISAVYRYSRENDKLGRLCMLTGCLCRAEEDISQALLQWLFNSSVSDLPTGTDPILMGKKLCSLMELAEVSNRSLAVEIDIDPAYISRWRHGKPARRSAEKIEKLCSALVRHIRINSKQPQLALLAGNECACADEAKAAQAMLIWLTRNTYSEDINAMEALISRLGTEYTGTEGTRLPPIEQIIDTDILDEADSSYLGREGLRRAVIRFLGNAAVGGSSELMLYSDQNMDWMGGDFRIKWSALMAACLNRGIKVRIIHNIDRDTSEMIAAITAWLPLYMTGLIDAYYSSSEAGTRFTHTVFLDPSRGCIECFCPAGSEETAEYRYMTDTRELDLRSRFFAAMLKDCRPLVTVTRGSTSTERDKKSVVIGNILFSRTDSSVTVTRLSSPKLSFTFTHPLMLRAFSEYLRYQSENNENTKTADKPKE